MPTASQPNPPPDFDVPNVTADYQVESFQWCQVIYLYARELNKAGVKWTDALQEARRVVGVLEQSGVPLSPDPWNGAYGPVVHWPTMVCAANAYASLNPVEREYQVELMQAGKPPYISLAFGEGGCSRKVLDDEEYKPAPPCVPQTAAMGLFLGIGVFAGVFGGLSLLGWLFGGRKVESRGGRA